MQLLSLGQLVNFATGSVGIMLMMTGRSDIVFANSIAVVLLSLGLDFWLVPAYGLVGGAAASAFSIAVLNLVRLGEVWVLMRMHPFSRAFLKPIIAAIPAIGVGLAWIRWLPLNSIIFLGLACLAVGLVYLAALLLLGLDEGDRLMIDALRTRFLRMPLLRRRSPEKTP